jgi:ornithine decarboxylase
MSHYIYNLNHLNDAHSEWYPHIKPFYAVKCNPNRELIHRLKTLGLGFDCASRSEIQTVLDEGVDPNNIIYANPCKRIEDVMWAKEHGVTLTTFDSIYEAEKLRGFDCILRIRNDDANARCILGVKYGVQECDWENLIVYCKFRNVRIVGVSFHIGSGSESDSAHQQGVRKAMQCLDLCFKHGHKPHIIDLGGGFSYKRLPQLVTPRQFTIIAEPGRYYAEGCVTLKTKVIGKKDASITIDESIYGAFNCKMFDHANPEPSIKGEYETTVYGCTCDGIDTIGLYKLPLLHIGDYIEWKNMGAYTVAASTKFNGMNFPINPEQFQH